ncbi:acetyltransferase (GNAT) family protein [Nocardioides albertanoniae]|uniref:Acetyltransferase (GNAT) family protein n=1 Tax=Nocardioides albertanoniae TaxID=1175486 RepID=A0A543A7Y2_9ACTN|nr:GNAT family N-acetyltransferase [Nocardioides albertanoniae]TQL68629.1 acetyltransferase (GNAT) family protein [Nocardioides albertanoniae]
MPKHPSTDFPRIRAFQDRDLDAVVELSLLAWEPVFVSFENVLGTIIFDHMYRPDWQTAQATAVRANCLNEDTETYVVVTEHDQPVGFAVLLQDQAESVGVVDMIAVHPDHQRHGHARRLMELAIDRFHGQGLDLVNVATGGDPGHAPARALYEAVGFTGLPLKTYYLAGPPR